MRQYLLTGITCLITLSASAKRNSFHVGILTGTTGTYKTHDVAPHQRLHGDLSDPAISFTCEYNFDKKGKRLYLSIPIRLHTFRFDVSERYATPYYSLYSSYNYSQNGTVSSASLGAGLAINWVPFGNNKVAMLTNLNAMPIIEAGNFMGVTRANAVSELYAGIRLNNKILIGARVVHFFRDYQIDNFSIPDRNAYNVTNVQFDLRFNIKAK